MGGLTTVGIFVFVLAIILNLISRRSIRDYLTAYLVAIGFIVLGLLVEYKPDLGKKTKQERTPHFEQSFSPKRPKVNFTENSIEIMNFPDVLLGRTGINSIDWSKDYDFNSLNKKIYKKLGTDSFNSNSVNIRIHIERENKYGNKSYDRFSIGTYDVNEAKKYSDYSHWKSYNDIERIAERFLVKGYTGR